MKLKKEFKARMNLSFSSAGDNLISHEKLGFDKSSAEKVDIILELLG